MKITGDVKNAKGEFVTEVLELWHRDPVECIAKILGNPSFKGHQAYSPEHHFRKNDGINHEYSEMWTADWWWNVQVSILDIYFKDLQGAQKKLQKGATIAPVIIASDETQLSQFSRDKKAWPVYLSIGNIEKGMRRKPSS